MFGLAADDEHSTRRAVDERVELALPAGLESEPRAGLRVTGQALALEQPIELEGGRLPLDDFASLIEQLGLVRGGTLARAVVK